jgi:hypothetical protein
MTESVAIAPAAVPALCGDPHVLGLLLFLRGPHGLSDEFTAPDTLAVTFGWPLRQLRGARRRAVAAGWLVNVAPPKRSQPARYVFGRRCWVDLPDGADGADAPREFGGQAVAS